MFWKQDDKNKGKQQGGQSASGSGMFSVKNDKQKSSQNSNSQSSGGAFSFGGNGTRANDKGKK